MTDTATQSPTPSARGPDPAYTRRFSHLPYFGSRIEVYRGQARYTKGFLTRDDLMKSKKGRVVSRRAHQRARAARPLGQYLDFIEGHKGQFTLMHRGMIPSPK